jgi:hypothetical protein
MIEILRSLTIRKGGIYAHWGALAARSLKSNDLDKMGNNITASHAHAARMHKGYVREKVAMLFQATPGNIKLCFVKEEVLRIKDGCPPSHPRPRTSCYAEGIRRIIRAANYYAFTAL